MVHELSENGCVERNTNYIPLPYRWIKKKDGEEQQ